MNPYQLGFIVFSAIFVSCTYTGTLLMFALIGKVNRYRPDDNQVPYFRFPPRPSKNLENLWIFGEYHRLYPNGRLHVYFFLVVAVGFISLIVAMSCLFNLPPGPSVG